MATSNESVPPAASDPASTVAIVVDGMIRRRSPVDNHALHDVRQSSLEDVQRSLSRARQAQAEWAALPMAERVKAMARVRKRFLDAADRIVDVLSEENGKPPAESLTSEVIPNVDLFDYWIREAPKLLRPRPVPLSPINFPRKRGAIEYRPRGVIALISPWNFPVALPLRTLVPALLAGNAAVFKPSEHSALSGALLAEILQSELPTGVVELVQGAGEVGAALCQGDVDMVVFTGSVATGRKVAMLCAARLLPCSLELGGKDAALVLDDADIERAAQGIAWAGFANAGQNCAAVERVYVDRAVAKRFTERLVEITRTLRLGTDVGPLTTDAQLAIVKGQLADAVEKGARVACGGRVGPQGRYVEPTVLCEVTDDMLVMRDETFGPLLPVVVVAGEAEAIRRANDSRYGLTASIWTRNLARGERVARELRAGVLTVNNHAFTGALPGAPWGGVGESGHGITNSLHALYELCRPVFVLVDASRATRELWWYPYTPAFLAIGKAMVGLLRDALPQKPAQIARLLASFPQRFKDPNGKTGA